MCADHDSPIVTATTRHHAPPVAPGSGSSVALLRPSLAAHGSQSDADTATTTTTANITSKAASSSSPPPPPQQQQLQVSAGGRLEASVSGHQSLEVERTRKLLPDACLEMNIRPIYVMPSPADYAASRIAASLQSPRDELVLPMNMAGPPLMQPKPPHQPRLPTGLSSALTEGKVPQHMAMLPGSLLPWGTIIGGELPSRRGSASKDVDSTGGDWSASSSVAADDGAGTTTRSVGDYDAAEEGDLADHPALRDLLS
eukprot:GHVU01086284.1.p1 GENE.GHVU01086284.1~~GHVU01086284.1.p1  ORF type:complete len:256 (-),score=34.34 GHVU01086284.1:671-1438(-)